MINYTSIINLIVKELHEFADVPIIPQNDTKPKEYYPFVIYNLTNAYNPEVGQETFRREAVESTNPNPNFDYDILETYEENPTITISFTACTKNNQTQAAELSAKCIEWFESIGWQTLNDNNICVVEITSVQDRGILLVDYYEKRFGFDVILRVSANSARRLPTIETFEIEQVE